MRTVPFLGTAIIDIHIPWSRSLKDRRQVLRSVVDHLRHHWNVSVADLSPDGAWHRGCVAVCCVGDSAPTVREKLDALASYFSHREEEGDFLILERRFEVMGYDEFSH